ncbi:MAG: M23 family metallopeptidase [Proteobacteria bacterium]|nr:M23 family metallopeptidase [Pseudomonadota bacterium]MDA1310611.1 M23 family metallopeptidase [Pseudomonadota bacterium]
MIALTVMAVAAMVLTTTISSAFAATRLQGRLIQGGLVIGTTTPGSTVTLDGRAVRVGLDGRFVFGFNRDATAAALAITAPDGTVERRQLSVEARGYDIQRIDGLPPKTVSPPPEVLARIRRESAQIKAARMQDTPVPYFKTGFKWPARGRISGVYGSQRVLNGKPSRPHYGIDVAAPVGTPVAAPADGVVRLAEPDLFYSGGTIILDHGHGLSSTFLHMATVEVQPGDQLRQGDRLGTIGATGRATGPHLDWRINWFDQRLDAGLLVPPMP